MSFTSFLFSVLQSDYPYTGHDGKCYDSTIKTYADVESFVDVPSNNYTALMAAALHTPVAVGVAAMNWGDYQGGVYPNELCDGDIDHAVLLVGWGTDPGLGDYWKIKNSWGSGWGADGYIYLERGGNAESAGKCGMLSAASYPTL